MHWEKGKVKQLEPITSWQERGLARLQEDNKDGQGTSRRKWSQTGKKRDQQGLKKTIKMDREQAD